MTAIKVAHKGRRHIILITGHSQFADAGKDIVCAATSMLSYTLANNLIADYGADVKVGDGTMVIDVRGGRNVRCIIDAIMVGYDMLAKSYPTNVRVNR